MSVFLSDDRCLLVGFDWFDWFDDLTWSTFALHPSGGSSLSTFKISSAQLGVLGPLI
jgi:hypothetical protein